MCVHGNTGLVRLFSGDIDHARQAFDSAVRLCARHAFASDANEGLVGLAAVAATQGRHETAAMLRGAARAAGYPPTTFDQRIDHRLERVFFASARISHGETAWDNAEQAGATLHYQQAIAYALQQPA